MVCLNAHIGDCRCYRFRHWIGDAAFDAVDVSDVGGASATPEDGEYPLSGGGIRPLTAADFIGDASARTGLAGLEGYEDIQVSFLNMVKKRLPPNISLADEISDILDISRDSAYRRLRGETILSLTEVRKISNHYGISLDTLLNTQNDSITFQYRSINNESFTFLFTFATKLSFKVSVFSW